MTKNHLLAAPFFEVGPKQHLFGAEAVRFAQQADELAARHGVTVIYSAAHLDIRPIAESTKHLLVFAQHVDGVLPGRGQGAILPEAVRAAGAVGTLLNHAERKLSLRELSIAIARSHEAGLTTLVCVETIAEAVAAVRLGADALLKESEASIGMADGASHDLRDLADTMTALRREGIDVPALHGAGITDSTDVYNIIKAGADATGSTSGIFRASDPLQELDNMLAAVQRAWSERTSAENAQIPLSVQAHQHEQSTHDGHEHSEEQQ